MLRSGFFILIIMLVMTAKSFAADVCVNDPDGTRGVKGQQINTAFHNATDPLTKAFTASQSKTACPPTSTPTKTAKDMSAVTGATLNIGKIKAECIQASLQREVGNTGYTCAKGVPTAFDNAKSSAQCLNKKTADFIQYSVNQAINCMSPPEDPIDPRVILKKINNETGFNFYLGYVGGVGIGQLTSDPVNEIAGWWDYTQVRDKRTKKIVKTKSKYNPGNAHSILETLAASNNPACAPFKKIVEKELNDPPPTPGSKKNYCSWVSVGDGVARSLVYGLGYFVYARDHFIKDTLKERAPELAKSKELVNALTLVAYGPGGPAQAKALIRKLRLNDRSNAAEALKKVTNDSAYVSQTNDKMKELLANLKKPNPTPEELRGDSCVSK